jgi:putative permease
MKPIRDWFKQTFSDPQVLLLTVILLIMVAAIMLVANMVAPVIAALVIAFLLDGVVIKLKRLGLGHLVAVNLVFAGFFLVSLLFLLGLMPVLFRQVSEFVQQAPAMSAGFQDLLLKLPEKFPDLFTVEQIHGLMADMGRAIVGGARLLPSLAGTSLVTFLTAIVYIILVLLLVFFMIKDKEKIIGWINGFLPRDRELTTDVWRQVNRQIGNYVRGKFWEILIVGIVTYVVFAALGVNFSALLAVITGLSVLIPYVGAAAVTVPVALVGFVQWGPSINFVYVVLAYGVIQALDGNLLAPLLFSEVVDLHPIAIIVAILIFGGLWGFWGVFFAIPLATVVQAVLRAWPRTSAWRKPIH